MAREFPRHFLLVFLLYEGCAMSDEHFCSWMAVGASMNKSPRPSLRFNFCQTEQLTIYISKPKRPCSVKHLNALLFMSIPCRWGFAIQRQGKQLLPMSEQEAIRWPMASGWKISKIIVFVSKIIVFRIKNYSYRIKNYSCLPWFIANFATQGWDKGQRRGATPNGISCGDNKLGLPIFNRQAFFRFTKLYH